jgi:hypothetical protein
VHCLPRILGAAILSLSLSSPQASAFDTALSDEAVREAYFLGRRHDGSFQRLLEKYTRHLPPPKTGPYISSVTFLTPFAKFAQLSDRHSGDYSAQQAAFDHRGQSEEIVQIVVEIQLTDSYGRLIPTSANSRSNPPSSVVPRPHDFWRDFQTRIYDGDQELTPATSHGHANSSCGRRGPCMLIGATLEFDFPADAFTSGTAAIQVTPPEGDPVSVDFDLTRLR